MLFNYFKTAIRNFKRNLLFSFINIVGLAIGISASLVIYLLVHFDLTFDKFHKQPEQIYRVVSIMEYPGMHMTVSGVPMPLAQAIRQDMPAVQTVAPFYFGEDKTKVSVPINSTELKKYRTVERIVYADNNYFKVFNYQWLAGSETQALTDPFKVVLTASRAKAYFKVNRPEEAIGRVLIYNDSIRTTVSGIVNDLTENSDLRFNEFISFSTIKSSGLENNIWTQWNNISSNSQLFIRLKPRASQKDIDKQLIALYRKNTKDDRVPMQALLQPLADLHFNPAYDVFGQRQANTKTLYGLLAVAGILLLLGCINFVNLTTAQAVHRAKEIGVRKTMGGSQKQLLLQFLSETLVITTMAAVLSLLLVPLLLRMFADFIPPGLHFNLLHQPDILLFTMCLVLVVSLLSGFYPAMVLARYNPVTALKNQTSGNGSVTRNAWLRKSLTVTQFVAAQAFIIATIMVTRQIHYVLNKDLGFSQNSIVTTRIPWNRLAQGKQKVLVQQLKSIPQIEQVVLAGSPPAEQGYSTTTMKYADGKKVQESSIEVKFADAEYFRLYHMKLLAGQYLAPSDSLNGLLVNESFVRFMGLKKPADAIGKFIDTQRKHLPIVGVLANFYNSSLHSEIKPLAYMASTPDYAVVHIKLTPQVQNWQAGLKGVEEEWKRIYPEDDFSYEFLSESIANFYKSEQNISRLLTWATGLAILISCLGLMGLVIHTTAQRTKEIGVRKVLGASVTRIVALLSTDFLKLILVAIVIASPLAWYATSKWMQSFAYRTNLNWSLFLLAGMITVCVAVVTISFNAIKAAMANPVKSLRND